VRPASEQHPKSGSHLELRVTLSHQTTPPARSLQQAHIIQSTEPWKRDSRQVLCSPTGKPKTAALASLLYPTTMSNNRRPSGRASLPACERGRGYRSAIEGLSNDLCRFRDTSRGASPPPRQAIDSP
jgi:hypothetical protein